MRPAPKNKKLPIHIAFCVNNAYVQYITVTIQSIVDHHRDIPVVVHILSDNIKKETRRHLHNEFDNERDLEIIIHDVDDSPLDGLKAWSKYTWYRLLLPTVLPDDVHRVLYLDADTLVTDNLSKLFEIDMKDKAIAGVIDPMNFEKSAYQRCQYPMSKQYICAGVMLVNLDYWRQNDLQAKMIEWGLANVDIKFHDQDCINYICQDSKILLPLRYGVVDALFTIDKIYKKPYIDEVEECIDKPAIVHYAGKAPWHYDCAVHPLSKLWHNTNARLRRSVARSYKSKGILKLKIMLYDIMHPGNVRKDITIPEIKQRLIDARMKE